MERTGQCHCGSLRVIATGESDRVYLCHIWEESMHPWLGMPPSMDHHQQGRPPAT
jgi:hypothetical protein